jgi:hypothetical protein
MDIQGNLVLFLLAVRVLSFLEAFQTTCGAHRLSYPVAAGEELFPLQ